MEEDKDVPIIMGQPFLGTRRTLIDVVVGELIMRLNNEQVIFNIFKAMEYPNSTNDNFTVSIIQRTVSEVQERSQSIDSLERLLTIKNVGKDEELVELMAWLNSQPSSSEECGLVKPLPVQNTEFKVNIPSDVQPPEFKLKPLPKHLRYVFLGLSSTLPIIISTSLTPLQEEIC